MEHTKRDINELFMGQMETAINCCHLIGLSQPGQFLITAKVQNRCSDVVLKEHQETADRNVIYTSKEIQNQMIVTCGDIIRGKILKKVRKARPFL